MEPEEFPKGCGFMTPCIPTLVIIQTLSIYKRYTSNIVQSGRAILEELILCICLATGAIFSRFAQKMKLYGSALIQ